MQIVPWLKTHIPLRNGVGGITVSFIAPEYQIQFIPELRLFHIFKRGAYVTSTGMENVAECTFEGITLEQETSKKARSKAS